MALWNEKLQKKYYTLSEACRDTFGSHLKLVGGLARARGEAGSPLQRTSKNVVTVAIFDIARHELASTSHYDAKGSKKSVARCLMGREM